MRTAAVLPVKSFARAKQRLRASVLEALRRELAEAMVADVLAALERTAGIERTIVVTREPRVAGIAGAPGVLLLDDAAESGQSHAAAIGVARARADGFERVLCVPGDCPAMDPRELERLLAADAAAAAEGPAVTVLPDRHGSGTNGLLLRPPGAIAPSFGPGSCARHQALAAAAGVPCAVRALPSLLLDVDTGADLGALRARLAARAGGATRTRTVLDAGRRDGAFALSGRA
ncbi:MAG TPA: 2-phospho-L-lactate guanylyltransferase [Solirubrobacteraceae bacterium]|nr:2-phospho-L-lactate guanylyltransferase [Solirubrobacteraceae bacterium]